MKPQPPATMLYRLAYARARRAALGARRFIAAAPLVAEATFRHPSHAARVAAEAARLLWRSRFRAGGLLYRLENAFLYPEWVRRHDTLDAAARRRILARIEARADWPLISVVMMPPEGEPLPIEAAIGSIRAQLYAHWELCVAADPSTGREARSLFDRQAGADPRIKIINVGEGHHRVDAVNSALGLCSGTFVAFVDDGCILAEHALYRVTEELHRYPDTDAVLSDSDSIDERRQRTEPRFSPGFDLELLLGRNSAGALPVLRRSLVEATGGLRPGFDGGEVFDLLLRGVAASARDRLRHIPAILCHDRGLREGRGASSADRIAESGRRAVAEFLATRGIAAEVEAVPQAPQWNRVRHRLPEPPPSVSLIVPTRNRAGLLRRVMAGVLDGTDYSDLDVIVADNGSDDDETLALFAELRRDQRVRVFPFPGPFNFSAINNAAARESRGQVLAFLNNDIAVTDRGWLKEMVSRALQPDVGAVGAKLRYPGGRIQHAGVTLGMRGVAGHWFAWAPPDLHGPAGELLLARETSAATAACMAIRRSVFEEVGGFDAEHLAVDFNDVDLCLRLRERGYRIVWTPFADLIHDESASRRFDPKATGRRERRSEAAYMRARWRDAIADDPCFSPNLSLRTVRGSLAFPPRVKQPWDD